MTTVPEKGTPVRVFVPGFPVPLLRYSTGVLTPDGALLCYGAPNLSNEPWSFRPFHHWEVIR